MLAPRQEQVMVLLGTTCHDVSDMWYVEQEVVFTVYVPDATHVLWSPQGTVIHIVEPFGVDRTVEIMHQAPDNGQELCLVDGDVPSTFDLLEHRGVHEWVQVRDHGIHWRHERVTHDDNLPCVGSAHHVLLVHVERCLRGTETVRNHVV